jgi:hypothetical protein
MYPDPVAPTDAAHRLSWQLNTTNAAQDHERKHW